MGNLFIQSASCLQGKQEQELVDQLNNETTKTGFCDKFKPQ